MSTTTKTTKKTLPSLPSLATAPATTTAWDMVSDIIEWEGGDMNEERELVFFEHMVSSGMVYKLQGCYGRRAHELGLI